MKSTTKRIPAEVSRITLSSGIFFTCFYLYTYIFIEPQLIYHGFGSILKYPVFSLSWSTFEDYLIMPGGVIKYVSAFLSQLYFFNWLGALIITLIAWFAYLGTKTFITSTGNKDSKVLCYIPALFLLMMYNYYEHILSIYLAMTIAVWLSIFYQRIPWRSSLGRTAAFFIIFSVLYYIAVGTSLLFAALAIIY